MQGLSLIVLLGASLGVQASISTISVCTTCPNATSTVDVVTRSDIPTTSCTGAALTVISHATSASAGNSTAYSGTGTKPTSTGSPSSTVVPVSGGDRLAGSLGGALVLGMLAHALTPNGLVVFEPEWFHSMSGVGASGSKVLISRATPILVITWWRSNPSAIFDEPVPLAGVLVLYPKPSGLVGSVHARVSKSKHGWVHQLIADVSSEKEYPVGGLAWYPELVQRERGLRIAHARLLQAVGMMHLLTIPTSPAAHMAPPDFSSVPTLPPRPASTTGLAPLPLGQ
ncbi:hypothetical protein JX265_005708 [Neoarthrinium moseri]|uniref:Uncharacterized protein n=2 Tax=Neoarthrinium moseri TaxID=1658444 RepID=A0A9Q0AMH4_9PEZI|nr:hypothetical protein JX265_005708 [Neoarthrinium moseri]